MSKNPAETLKIHPIGKVQQSGGSFSLVINEPFRPALKELDQFGHVLVFWWSHLADSEEERKLLQVELPYAGGKLPVCLPVVRPGDQTPFR